MGMGLFFCLYLKFFLFKLENSIRLLCCGADKYVDPANELCEREQPKQYEGTKVR